MVHDQIFFIGSTIDQELGWLLGDRDETAPAAPKSSQSCWRDRHAKGNDNTGPSMLTPRYLHNTG